MVQRSSCPRHIKIFGFRLNFLIPTSRCNVTVHKGLNTHTYVTLPGNLTYGQRTTNGTRYIDLIQLASIRWSLTSNITTTQMTSNTWNLVSSQTKPNRRDHISAWRKSLNGLPYLLLHPYTKQLQLLKRSFFTSTAIPSTPYTTLHTCRTFWPLYSP